MHQPFPDVVAVQRPAAGKPAARRGKAGGKPAGKPAGKAAGDAAAGPRLRWVLMDRVTRRRASDAAALTFAARRCAMEPAMLRRVVAACHGTSDGDAMAMAAPLTLRRLRRLLAADLRAARR
jgi:hypothetical protein